MVIHFLWLESTSLKMRIYYIDVENPLTNYTIEKHIAKFIFGLSGSFLGAVGRRFHFRRRRVVDLPGDVLPVAVAELFDGLQETNVFAILISELTFL
jgi:hypothetical protein